MNSMMNLSTSDVFYQRIEAVEAKIAAVWAKIDSEQTTSMLADLCRDVLSMILQADPSYLPKLKAAAKASHSHDNGFLKLNLYDTRDANFRLRIHVWNTPSALVQGNVQGVVQCLAQGMVPSVNGGIVSRIV